MPEMPLGVFLGKVVGRVSSEGRRGDTDAGNEGDRKGGCCPHAQQLVALIRGPGQPWAGGPPSRAQLQGTCDRDSCRQ